MKEHIYTLKSTFNYATKDGDAQEATFLTLRAPDFTQMRKVAPIKQAFFCAIKSAQDEKAKKEKEDTTIIKQDKDIESNDDDDGVNGEQCIQLLYSSHVDVSKVILNAELLFVSGVASVNGEIPVTSGILKKLTMEDFEGLLGEYISNFIMPSPTDGQ